FAQTSTNQKDLSTAENLDYVTKKTKLMLVLLPEWSPYFPPFNLARLSAVAKQAGYHTRLMDVNVRAYNEYRLDWQPNKKTEHRLWNPAASWRLVGKENYLKNAHPLYEPLFLKVIEEILAFDPEVVGFSQYYINEQATDWMAEELKKRKPGLIIAVGGSNLQNGWYVPKPFYDYAVSGEGEESILEVLDEVEGGKGKGSLKHIRQPEEQRISINDLPLPDYSSIDFNQYEIPNGVNSEFSRGCVAKCTFCEETHFYKYRQRTYVDAVREIEYLYHQKGTNVIWFIDSLVNGSLKELRAFCKSLIEKGLKVNWTGYARCDGRMDLDFYKDLAAAGCVMLNYGIESGSQKVLNDMNKGITVEEVEQNLRDGKETGVWAATNWIIGFPTEEYQDFGDTMTFLWRNRDMNINNIGAGVGFSMGLETIIAQNPERFNLLSHKYMGHWITKDFKLSGTHLMVRVKSFNIFLDHLVAVSVNKPSYPIRENLKGTHYEITFDDPTLINEIGFEKFDYNIIKPNISPYADSLVNEIWPLLRTLWRVRGGYNAVIRFNPKIDLQEFGLQYNPGSFTGEYKFKIDRSGKWSADFKFDFTQISPDPATDHREPERQGPFIAQEYSRIKSASATRARKLAKPIWGEEGRNEHHFWELLTEERVLNQTVNFTFKHAWAGTGDWGSPK
ncbi:MAG: B12-binding domain-containing radical SAM protein, partial [Bdellovibrionaceae bacterium]|nr:B12-binding domain-containing radical SAM protein [Pseudobdellovibrionaceae bacterium]